MPVTISDLLGASKTLDVPVGAGKFTLTYDPTKITQAALEAATKAADTSAAAAVCTFVSGWDLADDQGDIPVGIGQETAVASRVPLPILAAVTTALVADQTPNPPSATN